MHVLANSNKCTVCYVGEVHYVLYMYYGTQVCHMHVLCICMYTYMYMQCMFVVHVYVHVYTRLYKYMYMYMYMYQHEVLMHMYIHCIGSYTCTLCCFVHAISK